MNNKNQNATKNEKNHKKLTPEAVALVIEGLEADKPQARNCRRRCRGFSENNLSLDASSDYPTAKFRKSWNRLRDYLQPNELALMMPKIAKRFWHKASLEMQEVSDERQIVRVHSLTKRDWESDTRW